MDDYTKKDMEEARRAIASAIGRSEKAQAKFAPGTSQHTLHTNRIKALYIASSLLAKELAGSSAADSYTKEDLEKALAPIASLASKSEKAREKLTQGKWQHAMLSDLIKALRIASSLLTEALRDASAENERGE